MLDGIAIISIAELNATQKEHLVLIVIADRKARENLRNVLKDKNYNMSLVYDMSFFIMNNEQCFYGSVTGYKECLLVGTK